MHGYSNTCDLHHYTNTQDINCLCEKWMQEDTALQGLPVHMRIITSPSVKTLNDKAKGGLSVMYNKNAVTIDKMISTTNSIITKV